jgi:hypothetical protein
MDRELSELFASARRRELEPSEFVARLDSLHIRLLGATANSDEMVKRRRDAARAYDDFLAEAGMDRHHHLERLADALGHAPAN